MANWCRHRSKHALVADRFPGTLIKSFAMGASSSDFSIMLWAWTEKKVLRKWWMKKSGCRECEL
ncbi:MAG: hypothetical protein HoeaKO_34160 [Hoeflea alexandrii]